MSALDQNSINGIHSQSTIDQPGLQVDGYTLEAQQEEIELLKANIKQQRAIFNDFAEKTNAKFNTFTSLIESLSKENQQLKAHLATLKFEIHPVTSGFQVQPSNAYQDNFMNSTRIRQAPQHTDDGSNNHQLIDNHLGESNNNNGILRFINNQYVGDDQALTNQQTSTHSIPSNRAEFIHMQPSSRQRNRGDHSFNTTANDDDDERNIHPTLQSASKNSRIHKRTPKNNELTDGNRPGADNFELVIRNDFTKVEELFNEFENSLKPQVEQVSKAYKIKKIRKYQKIKALAVRIKRFMQKRGRTMEESCQFFDDLRNDGEGNKKSIAWLYNTLPEILKKHGLDEELNGKGGNNNDDDDETI